MLASIGFAVPPMSCSELSPLGCLSVTNMNAWVYLILSDLTVHFLLFAGCLDDCQALHV